MSTWIDYTRRSDPAQDYYVEKLSRKLAQGHRPDVLCFWTKAPGWVARHYAHIIHAAERDGVIVLAQVTWNNGYDVLEPGVDKNLAELKALVDLLGPDKVRLRFDPIIMGFTTESMFNNCLNDAALLGIERITTNFLVPRYKNVGALLAEKYHIYAKEASVTDRVRILHRMVSMAQAHNVGLAGCAEIYRDKVDEQVPGLYQTGCSDATWERQFNHDLQFVQHASRPGCRCCYSDDWGEYTNRGGPKCPHQCVYCYAK